MKTALITERPNITKKKALIFFFLLTNRRYKTCLACAGCHMGMCKTVTYIHTRIVQRSVNCFQMVIVIESHIRSVFCSLGYWNYIKRDFN